MSTISTFIHLSLDGVMQAPGDPQEDTRDGFAHGGWAGAYADPVLGEFVGGRMSGGGPGNYLFGRRTYEHFYEVWPNRTDNPFTDVLNKSQKYVASTTLSKPLPWENSTLLQGNVPDAVAVLKAASDANFTILGSGELIRSLLPHNLIDELVLVFNPIVLGSGRRLFTEDGTLAKFALIESKPTTTGAIITVYHPAEPAR